MFSHFHLDGHFYEHLYKHLFEQSNKHFYEHFYEHLYEYSYGKPAPGAESHYEFCCYFPQNAHTLHALESSIFIGFLCRLLRCVSLS